MDVAAQASVLSSTTNSAQETPSRAGHASRCLRSWRWQRCSLYDRNTSFVTNVCWQVLVPSTSSPISRTSSQKCIHIVAIQLWNCRLSLQTCSGLDYTSTSNKECAVSATCPSQTGRQQNPGHALSLDSKCACIISLLLFLCLCLLWPRLDNMPHDKGEVQASKLCSRYCHTVSDLQRLWQSPRSESSSACAPNAHETRAGAGEGRWCNC